MDQVFQVVGACLVLAAFVAAQVRLLDQRSYLYLLLNLSGWLSWPRSPTPTGQWGFLLLEGVWALVSLAGANRGSRVRRATTPDATYLRL